MTAYEIYERIVDKARALVNVAQALNQLHPAKKGMLTLSDEHTVIVWLRFGTTRDCEREWEKDERRAVKLLYKDYCTLRDELRAMLSAEYDAR